MDLKHLQSSFTFNMKRFHKKIRLVSHTVGFGHGQDHFPATRFWLFSSAEPFGPNHMLSSPDMACQPVFCAHMSLAHQLMSNCPLLPLLLLSCSQTYLLLVQVAPGYREQLADCVTAQCWRMGLCPAGDLLQKISTRRPCFLQLLLNLLPKGKRLVTETTKTGFWMQNACTIFLEQMGQYKVRRCLICLDLLIYQTRHCLLFHSKLGSSLLLLKLHCVQLQADTHLWTPFVDTAGTEPVSR